LARKIDFVLFVFRKHSNRDNSNENSRNNNNNPHSSSFTGRKISAVQEIVILKPNNQAGSNENIWVPFSTSKIALFHF